MLTSITMAILVAGIVALAIGYGGIYPNFKWENISQVSTGFGAISYMLTSIVFVAVVVVLEAGPVYVLFMAGIKGTTISFYQWLYIVLSFLGVLIFGVVAVILPIKKGIKSLELYEWGI